MKVYIQAHALDERIPQGEYRIDIVVAYCESPDWTTQSRVRAEEKCAYLSRSGVHVGHHQCEFAVEEISDKEFAVVCLTHPDGTALSPPMPHEEF